MKFPNDSTCRIALGLALVLPRATAFDHPSNEDPPAPRIDAVDVQGEERAVVLELSGAPGARGLLFVGRPHEGRSRASEVLRAVRLDARGRADVLVPGWPVGETLVFQLALARASGSGYVDRSPVIELTATTSWTARRIGPFPGVRPGGRDLAVEAIVPASAAEGEEITLHGAFPPGVPAEICVGSTSADPATNDFFMLRVNERYADRLVCEVSAVGPAASPDTVTLMLGEGSDEPIDVTLDPRISIGPIRSFRKDDPAGIVVSTAVFAPVHGLAASKSCGLEIQHAYWTLQNGDLVLQVPQVHTGDRLRLSFHVEHFPFGRRELIDSSIDDMTVCTDSMPVVLNALALAVNSAIDDRGIDPSIVFAYTDVPNSRLILETTAGSFTFAGRGKFRAFPNRDFLSEDLGGEQDDFDTATSEPASPDPANGFESWLATSPPREFDEVAAATPFGHTLSSFGVGTVEAAWLEIRLRAMDGDVSRDDTLGLEFDGAAGFAWEARIRDLPEAAGSWDGEQTEVFCLALDALPAGGGSADVLALLLDGKLDVYVGENTAVDYAILRVRRCRP